MLYELFFSLPYNNGKHVTFSRKYIWKEFYSRNQYFTNESVLIYFIMLTVANFEPHKLCILMELLSGARGSVVG
jgi:hypothetical protein